MERLVECVPNFSEGRRPEVVARLVAAVESAGALVLDTHSDADHNRTVVTYVAAPEKIVEASVRAACVAVAEIDLRAHAGQHPRLGALDVLPFVPVRGVTLEDCIRLAHEAGERIWRELNVPVFFYESAARRPERVNLEDVRRGGFELLREEIAVKPERAPDVGEARAHETAGATIVGARSLLIAYNVNLRTTDVEVARRIAAAVRGRGGGLRFLKALGFELPARGLTQVSMNLVRFEKTQLHHAFEAVRREAARWGVAVAGTEIVGLIPQAALDRSAEYFLQIENFSPDAVLENRVAAALARKIERERARDAEAARLLIDDELAAARRREDAEMRGDAALDDEGAGAAAWPGPRAPAGDGARAANSVAQSSFGGEEITGGGVAAAHAANLAAAVGEMVARLLRRKSRQQDAERESVEALQELAALRGRLLEAADEDAVSFAAVLAARRMPSGGAEERRARAQAVEEALKGATSVPLEVARVAVRVAELLETLAELGDPAWLSDAAVGAQLALASAVGARYNVLVNTRELEDDESAAEHRARADDLVARARAIAERVEEMLLESVG